MTKIVLTVYTLEQINSKEVGNKVLNILEKYKFIPQKIGSYEPLRETYSPDKFIELWTEEMDGCYQEGVGMTGKAGGIIGKSSSPQFRFDMNWWLCPSKTNINYIDFYFPIRTFKNLRNEVEYFFKEIIILFNSLYGYISHQTPLNRQHVTGTILTRMPGVFWCNYYGKEYVDFFAEKTLYSFPWFRIENISDGILTFLSENPDKELIKSDNLELNAKNHLGEGSFGDLVEFQKNPDVLQIRSVPQFD